MSDLDDAIERYKRAREREAELQRELEAIRAEKQRLEAEIVLNESEPRNGGQ